MNNIEFLEKKTLQRKSVSKKRKVEKKTTEKKSLKRKLVQLNESETDGEIGSLNIVTSSRIKIEGKRISVNIPVAPLANVSFHFETSV